MIRNLQVFADSVSLADFVAKQILEQIKLSASKKSTYRLMLSGGKTAELLFNSFRKHAEVGFPWTSVSLYWADERFVPQRNDESNFGQAKRLWIDSLNLNENQVFPLFTGLSIKEEITRMNNVLTDVPYFDHVILGIGDDGHFASCFPGNSIIFQTKELLTEAVHPQTGQKRITVTPFLLQNKALNISIMISGSQKKDIFGKLNATEINIDLPAAMLNQLLPGMHWYADAEAAGQK